MRPMHLSIIVTSDLHGEYGRFQTIAREIRRRKPDLLIDNGDFVQGGVIHDHWLKHKHLRLPHPMIALANDLGYDCAVLGNHEFQEAPQTLRAIRAQSRFPWISCNVGDVARPYITKTIRGVKVAVLGVTTHHTPLWDEFGTMAEVRFEQALTAVRHWVAHIRQAEQPDFLIVSYHGGFAEDPDGAWLFDPHTGENEAMAMLSEITGIDLLITGHQHLCLQGERHGTPYVQPGSHGHWFAEISAVRRDGRWSVQTALVPVTEEGPLPTGVEAWLDEEIGHVAEDLTWQNPLAILAAGGHPYLDWFHRFQMAATGADLSVTELFFRESGGFHGRVTRRDVLANYPRAHKLVSLELTGQAIRAALEQNAAALALNKKREIDYASRVNPRSWHPYWIDYWGGLTCRMDLARPVGSRISDVRVKDEPLDMNKRYTVAMNSFRALGNEFPMYKDAPRRFAPAESIPDLLERHIRQGGKT